MPELIEISLITECIALNITGKYLKGLILHEKSRYCKNNVLNLHNKNLIGSPTKNENDYFYNLKGIVMEVFNYGKKILIEINDNGKTYYLTSFMSLFGTYRFDKANKAKHTLMFSDDELGTNCINLYYHDTRNWGIFSVVEDYREILNGTGPDYFSHEFNLEYYINCIKDVDSKFSKRGVYKDIGWFLMKQEYVSGVGVYLRNEILYCSKISPLRLLKNLSDEDIKNLYNNAKDIMIESYDHGGYSFKDFVDPNGVKGTFKPKITNKKYDDYGNLVVRSIHEGRNIDWVPSLQT